VSHVFVLDVVTKSWQGPWTGKFPGKVMAVATMSDPLSASKYQDPSLYIGSSDTDSGKVYHANDGTTDFGAPIAMRETSKRITFDQLETPKFYRQLYDLWEATSAETVLLEARVDGRDWIALTTLSVLGDGPTIPLTFPFSFGGVGIARGKVSLEDFGETPFDMQFRFTCTCTTQVKHLGYTMLAHQKNPPWDVTS
jgi:hypothetical protein